MRVAIIQPNYLPWKGYLDILHAVDAFIYLDDVQYTARDWRNRNKIKLATGGTTWLSVPVLGGRNQRLCDVQIDLSRRWARKHAEAIRHSYGRSKFFREPFEEYVAIIEKGHEKLVELDIELTELLCRWFGIRPVFHRSSRLGGQGTKDERLIELCRCVGGTSYLSGPSARDYIVPARWTDAGIELAYHDYAGYPEYPQISQPFDPFVSVLDLIFAVGPAEAPAYIWGPQRAR